MGKRGPSILGTSPDSQTARERTSLERRRLREIRLIEEFFRSDPRFPGQMTFSVFKAKLGRIVSFDGSRYHVKHWKGTSHWFSAEEQRRALEFAVRLLASRPIKMPSRRELSAGDQDSPKTIVTKNGKVVRVWRT